MGWVLAPRQYVTLASLPSAASAHLKAAIGCIMRTNMLEALLRSRHGSAKLSAKSDVTYSFTYSMPVKACSRLTIWLV